MADPRIQRTNEHVLAVLRQLLRSPGEEITITSLSAASKVSRRTLYLHWGSIEAAVADAEFGVGPSITRDAFSSAAKDPLRSLPDLIRKLDQFRLAALAAAQ